HEQAQHAEANRLCGQKSSFGLKQAQTDVAPDAIRYELDDKIERAVERSHGDIFPIRRHSPADDASAMSDIEDARLSPSASCGIKGGRYKKKDYLPEPLELAGGIDNTRARAWPV